MAAMDTDDDYQDWEMMTPEERRRHRVDVLMREATTLGIKLSRDDFEHEDLEEEFPDRYMTDDQINRMKEVERTFIDRGRATNPVPPPPTTPVPCHGSTNVVRLDAAIRSDVSDEFKDQLILYAPIERVYSLLTSWRLQEKEFERKEVFIAHLVRYGCTCIKQQENAHDEMLQFSLDMYYEQKKEDEAKRRQRRRVVKTAMRVARTAQHMSTLRRYAITDPEMPGSDSESDEEFDPSKALAVARGDGIVGDDLSSKKKAAREKDNIEPEEIPAFADDHAQLIVHVRRCAGTAVVTITSVHYVVWDPSV